MDLGVGKQTGCSVQNPWPDLKSCLRPLIASRISWGKDNSHLISLRKFILQIYLLMFTLFKQI